MADASGEGDGEGEGEAKLKTGDEAANFFARHGNHTPVKFVYLNRAKTGDTFKPYELVVVPREQREAEHFTMSACGVVHVYSSEQPSEFVTLSTWMQQARPPPPPRSLPPSPLTLLPLPQSTFFNVLSSIRFFKHYLAAKSFRLWRANVRYKLYTQQRSKLCRRLFLAKPAFCSTLLEINALCYELRTGENTRLMAPLSPNTHSSIDAFLEEQVQRSAVHTSPARPPPAAPPSPRSPSLPSPPLSTRRRSSALTRRRPSSKSSISCRRWSRRCART